MVSCITCDFGLLAPQTGGDVSGASEFNSNHVRRCAPGVEGWAKVDDCRFRRWICARHGVRDAIGQVFQAMTEGGSLLMSTEVGVPTEKGTGLVDGKAINRQRYRLDCRLQY